MSNASKGGAVRRQTNDSKQTVKGPVAHETAEQAESGTSQPGAELTKAAQPGTAVASYADYAGENGFGNTTAADYALPFLAVLQTNSPQVLPPNNGGIAGCTPGMIFNTVTQTFVRGDVGLGFVPAYTEHCWVEWLKREGNGGGGGFVGRHELESDFVKKIMAEAQSNFGKLEFTGSDGKLHELVETFYTYGVVVHEDGTTEMGVIGWTSTKIKQYKKFLTTARSIQILDPKTGAKTTPPLFAHRYRIKTFLDSNKKGTFYNFTVGWDGPDAASCRLPPTNAAFQEAYGLMKMVMEGAAKADYSTQNAAGEAEAERQEGTAAGGQQGGATQKDGKAPF